MAESREDRADSIDLSGPSRRNTPSCSTALPNASVSSGWHSIAPRSSASSTAFRRSSTKSTRKCSRSPTPFGNASVRARVPCRCASRPVPWTITPVTSRTEPARMTPGGKAVDNRRCGSTTNWRVSSTNAPNLKSNRSTPMHAFKCNIYSQILALPSLPACEGSSTLTCSNTSSFGKVTKGLR